MNKELEILKLQNRIVLLQGRTEKDNKNVQRKCLRKLKKITGAIMLYDPGTRWRGTRLQLEVSGSIPHGVSIFVDFLLKK